MISVLTLTYKRHHLLEEAIQSFLLQNCQFECEMVVINDNPDMDYIYEHPNVRVINHKRRFPSIASKLEWGFHQCKYEHVYRLDDDDLLAPNALNNACDDILTNPGYDIYRSTGFYFFVNNKYDKISSNINNGNIYSRTYIDRIVFPDRSIGEDADITFSNGAKIFESNKKPPTMCYRWGMGTLHISGMGTQPNETILAQADKVLDNTEGQIELHPQFITNYYEQIMDRLTEIANKLGTDKGTDSHCGHSYTLTYNQLFEPFTTRFVKMLEIGVADPRFPGASAKMWNEYFPHLYFVGYDINPEAKKFESGNVKIYIGDQNSPADLNNCVRLHGGEYDIILDDGSHHSEHMVTSFKYLFPHLKDGGYYILEDLHSVYSLAPQTFKAIDEIIQIEGYKVEKQAYHNGKLLVMKKAPK